MTTASSSRRRAPTRRPHRRYKPIRIGKNRWLVRGFATVLVLVVILVLWAVIARRVASTSNTSRDHFDVILVLGTPADADGNPTPEMLARVGEGVREYERGVAPRLIFTGGAAHNQYIEADVMANAAAAQGIPPSAIFVETKAKDTIQNACDSERLMREHGWHSAEVVSNDYHLPRASLIFGHTGLEWRMRAAPPQQAGESDAGQPALEVIKTVRYLVYANWAERCD